MGERGQPGDGHPLASAPRRIKQQVADALAQLAVAVEAEHRGPVLRDEIDEATGSERRLRHHQVHRACRDGWFQRRSECLTLAGEQRRANLGVRRDGQDA